MYSNSVFFTKLRIYNLGALSMISEKYFFARKKINGLQILILSVS